MRFRPDQHLRRQHDFRAVRERGRRIDCGAFTLWWLQRESTAKFPLPGVNDPAVAISPPVTRVGVVASTAAVGPAVQRNRAKRRLRSVFRHHQQLVPAGCDLLLVARGAVNRIPYTDVEQKFIGACRRIEPAKDN